MGLQAAVGGGLIRPDKGRVECAWTCAQHNNAAEGGRAARGYTSKRDVAHAVATSAPHSGHRRGVHKLARVALGQSNPHHSSASPVHPTSHPRLLRPWTITTSSPGRRLRPLGFLSLNSLTSDDRHSPPATMLLRNNKETVRPTMAETLADVHPSSLEEPFHWRPGPGESTVWVRTRDGKWRRGCIQLAGMRWGEDGRPDAMFDVAYHRSHGRQVEKFVPWDGEMKPDTPQVRALLRDAGYSV